MLNMFLQHTQSGITGKVDAEAVTPDGKAMVRIRDHWFMADDLSPAERYRR